MTTMKWSDKAASLMQDIFPTGREFPSNAYKRIVRLAEAIALKDKATLVCTSHVCRAIQSELETWEV